MSEGLSNQQPIVSERKEPTVTDQIRKNPWMLATIVLGVVLFILLLSQNGFSGISANDAGKNLVTHLNTVADSKFTLVSAKDSGSMYLITVEYNGDQIPLYVTKDGKSYAPSLVSLTGESNKKISDLDLSSYPTIGSSSAKVTIVEFSDFSCPFCAGASGELADSSDIVSYLKQKDPTWKPIVTNLMTDYVKTGKVRFVHIYAMGHSGGHPASLVGWCLNEQKSDLFWKFYSEVFQHQSDVEDLSKMKELAKGVGADMTKLNTCLDSKKYDSQFASEQAIADSVGAQGTPAFFIGDEYAAHGAESYVTFKAKVDAALASA